MTGNAKNAAQAQQPSRDMTLQGYDFRGATVFVSGGTSGINLGIAEAYAAAGAKVAVMSRNVERVEAACRSFVQARRGLGLGVLPQAVCAVRRERIGLAVEHRLEHDACDRAAQAVGAETVDGFGEVGHARDRAGLRAVVCGSPDPLLCAGLLTRTPDPTAGLPKVSEPSRRSGDLRSGSVARSGDHRYLHISGFVVEAAGWIHRSKDGRTLAEAVSATGGIAFECRAGGSGRH